MSSAGRETPESKLTWAQVRALALEAGFSEAGLVALPHAHEERDAARYAAWVAAGRAGSMRYLERRAPGQDGQPGSLLRARVATPFPWARSAIVCFANYNSPQPRSIDPIAGGDPLPEGDSARADAAWIARYAWSSRLDPDPKGGVQLRRPSDYHKVLKKRLIALEASLHRQFGAFEARGYVDTGPVTERALATAAGLGWTGKNTCLIHPKLGSYGFLAVLLVSLETESANVPTALPDRCGSCRRCIEACPTQALTAPYQMDATRCISYLTIEHRGTIAEELMEATGRQVFGCDICQDVCPWNRKAPIGADPELEARPELVNPTLDWLATLDEQEFERRFNGSPVRRAGFLGLRRNLAIAMGNSGQQRFAALLEGWAVGEDRALGTAVRWALNKLRNWKASPGAP